MQPSRCPAPEGDRYVYRSENERPMSVVFFASGGPGNLQTAFSAERLYPHRLRIDLVVTDRPGIPSIALARQYERPCWVFDFKKFCGTPFSSRPEPSRHTDYTRKREGLHSSILTKIQEMERARGYRFDLAVLAYRRIITGPLLEYFSDRMINQHPADLAERNPLGGRCFTGIEGHARAIQSGRTRSRTSTILVRPGVDAGEILVQGPWTPFSEDSSDAEAIRRHEHRQKIVSDRPALTFALLGIARGKFSLSSSRHHSDGCAVVQFEGEDLPYCGLQLNGDPGTHVDSNSRRDPGRDA